MILEVVPPSTVDDEWSWIADRFDIPDLRERLLYGNAAVLRIVGTDAALVLSLGTTRDTGKQALWVEALSGQVGFRPKDNTALLRDALGEIEGIGKMFGCSEIRIEAGTRTGLKKRLFPMFGFEAWASVMRKVI